MKFFNRLRANIFVTFLNFPFLLACLLCCFLNCRYIFACFVVGICVEADVDTKLLSLKNQ